MSYLDVPRIVFNGNFQADVSTINNVVGNYDNSHFDPTKDQQLNGNGGWNPEGTGIFRLIGCRISGAQLADRAFTSPAQDPIIGLSLENADDRVFGKLVDLDPQQQMVSQIWGMQLRLTDGTTPALFGGEFAPIGFVNLWRRQLQKSLPSDQVLGAVYQSVLRNVVWSGHAGSAVLEALRQATLENLLSIDFNLYSYGRNSDTPRYTTGKVTGTIGPYRKNEPKHFVIGRQLAPLANEQTQPVSYVDWFTCKVHGDRKVATADLGNCLPIVDAKGNLYDQGPLFLAVLKADITTLLASPIANDQVAILGEVSYRQPDWYTQTAGIQEFDYSGDQWCIDNIAQRPLLMLAPNPAGYNVLSQESLGGYYVRADNFVLRLDPGQSKDIELYASQYGKPLPGPIRIMSTRGMIGATGSNNQPPNVPIPDVTTPANGISFQSEVTADAAGKATLKVTGNTLNPPLPRGYIDGQLYGIGYQLAKSPPGTINNAMNFTSVLVFSPIVASAQPTWYQDIKSILEQYGNLYPIMSRHLVDLGEYESVVRHLNILRLAFSLPIEDPNHMPVTRDLSSAKRAMILYWMDHPGADGLPLKGNPAVASAQAAPIASMAPVSLDLAPEQTRGKIAALMEYRARQKGRQS